MQRRDRTNNKDVINLYTNVSVISFFGKSIQVVGLHGILDKNFSLIVFQLNDFCIKW